MKKVITNLFFCSVVLLMVCLSSTEAFAYDSGVYQRDPSSGGVYDDSPNRERPIRNNSSMIQRQAMQAAKRAEREAAAEARRMELQKRIAESNGGKLPENYKKNAEMIQDYKTRNQRNFYFSRQTPINEQKLLKMMSQEQRDAYNEEKLSKWYGMNPEERFLFVQSKQEQLNKEILNFEDKMRLETNF